MMMAVTIITAIIKTAAFLESLLWARPGAQHSHILHFTHSHHWCLSEEENGAQRSQVPFRWPLGYHMPAPVLSSAVGDVMMDPGDGKDTRKVPQAEECGRWPPQVEKEKETHTPLKPPEGASPADTLILFIYLFIFLFVVDFVIH